MKYKMNLLILFFSSVCLLFFSCQPEKKGRTSKFHIEQFIEQSYNQNTLAVTSMINREDISSLNSYSVHDTAASPSDTITFLGTGYNSITDELLAPNIIISSVDHSKPGGIDAQYTHADVATSYAELLKLTETSGGLSVGFGSFTGSAKAKALKSLQSSSSNCYLIFHSKIKHYVRRLKDPRLTDDTDVRRRLENYGNFLGYGGDEFVVQETYGGDLNIIFAAEAHDSKEHAENQKSFSAAAEALNPAAGADIKKATTEIQKATHLRLILIQNGGTGFSTDSSTLDTLLRYAFNFANQIKDHSVLVDFETMRYQQVKNFPSDYSGSQVVEESKLYMDSIITKLISLNDIANEVSFTIRNSGLFKPGFSDSIAKISPILANRIKELQACANRCRNSYSKPNCSNCKALYYPDTAYRIILRDPAP